jgi:polyhydroxyalkanoate synthesis regulator phasin
MERKRKLIFGVAALLAAAGGGVAVAASDSSPSEENQAIIDNAAKQLGISPSKLSTALKQALADRIDAAVAAGRLTKDEGTALKQRLDAGDFPLFGGLHRGFGHFGGRLGRLDAAANYLGLTETQLHSELEGGKTLAQVAQAHGKTANGLIDALVADAKKRLDQAVTAGRLTRSQANEMLSGLRDRIGALVNSRALEGDHAGRPDFGFRHFGRPPA